jgi:malate dehydrogenase
MDAGQYRIAVQSAGMSTVAILGAGPIGANVAHALARRARVRDIRLVDTAAGVAVGEALDIRQSGPIESYDTYVSGANDPLAAVGASVIVVADEHAGGEWNGDSGLAVIRRLVQAGGTGPFVFAGPNQIWLMESVTRELAVSRDVVVGSAAAAMAAAARGFVALDANHSGVDVSVPVCGRPPELVVGWSAATIGQSLVTDRVPAHRLRAITQQLTALWPPQPYAIAAATALIVEGLVAGTRRDVPGMTVLDDELGAKGVACLLPLTLGHGRIQSRRSPSLSPQERTALISTLNQRR